MICKEIQCKIKYNINNYFLNPGFQTEFNETLYKDSARILVQ